MRISAILFCCFMSSMAVQGQNFYDGSKEKAQSSNVELTFVSGQAIDGAPFAGPLALSAIKELPSVFALGYKITTDLIEKNAAKFTDEYSASNSYVDLPTSLPEIIVTRTFIDKNDNMQKALQLTLSPNEAHGMSFFELTDFHADYSGAKAKGKDTYMDYALELTIKYLVKKEDGKAEIKTHTSSIMNVQGYKLKSGTHGSDIRSDLFEFNDNCVLLSATVKVTESNPAKVKAEKLKDFSESYGDDVFDILKKLLDSALEGEEEDG